jgi:hypothetical protein
VKPQVNPTSDQSTGAEEGIRINWLSDDTMLPAKVKNARIMTFNYDSNWYGEHAVKVRLDHVANTLSRDIEDIREVIQHITI